MQDPKQLITENLKLWQEENSVTGEFEVSLIESSDFGDFSTNIAMISAKQNQSNPRELAEAIASFLKKNQDVNTIFDKIEVAGPGFINFFLSPNYLQNTLQNIVQNGEAYGRSNTKSEQTIIVEYSSPNIAKPFTIGHLRSTIIGSAIANLLEAVGATVMRDNHLGDWGTQFGKQIYAIKTWGDEEKIENAENPVKELVALYIKFHEEAEKDPSIEDTAREWFLKLEQGDDEARRLWLKCIDWSFKEFDRLYELLGVSFTENEGRGYGESYFVDKMQPVIEELRSKNLLIKDEGAELVYFPEDKYPPLMILKKDGSTLYATRDLATDKFRLEKYPNATIINEVGIEQGLYFKQLFEVEKILGWVKDGQRVHIKHGHFRFPEGKMSTRKGNVIWLEDVMNEARKRAFALSSQETKFEGSEAVTQSLKVSESAREYNPGVASRINNSEKIGIGALKWNDLKRGSEQDVTFDWDEILNMQGNSGPYVQYAYVRTQSVLGKVSSVKREGESLARHSGELATPESVRSWTSQDDGMGNENDGLKLEQEENELLRFLVQFPYILDQAANDFAPNLLCNYLFELAQKFNLFYQKCNILNPSIPAGSDPARSDLVDEIRGFRLNLTQAVGQVLQNGLSILGIPTVEKM